MIQGGWLRPESRFSATCCGFFFRRCFSLDIHDLICFSPRTPAPPPSSGSSSCLPPAPHPHPVLTEILSSFFASIMGSFCFWKCPSVGRSRSPKFETTGHQSSRPPERELCPPAAALHVAGCPLPHCPMKIPLRPPPCPLKIPLRHPPGAA